MAYTASDETIFTQTWWQLPQQADAGALLAKYTALRTVRTDVTKQLEDLRTSGAIGSSLQAELTWTSGRAVALKNSGCGVSGAKILVNVYA